MPINQMVAQKESHTRTAMQELRCPNDRKKLGEVREDYFDSPEEKNKYRNHGKVFIKCPKCKEIINF